MNNFKYILFPEQTYIISFEGSGGKTFTNEVYGKDIIEVLISSNALSESEQRLDKDERSDIIEE